MNEKQKSLSDFLKSKNFIVNFPVEILENELKHENEHVKAFILRGQAGVGKTELTRLISEFLNAKYVFYQCTLNSNEDDLLYRYVPDESTKSGIKVLPSVLPQATLHSQESKVVLTIDEFDKTRPSTDALLLDFLQNARISVRFESEEVMLAKKENLIVFLTSNDFREFSEPLLRRCIVLELKQLSRKDVYDLLIKRFNNHELVSLLTQIYEDTHNAKLRKAATIQELIQLGNLIQSNSNNTDLGTLIRSTIVKYDDDWEKYQRFLPTRKPSSFENVKSSEDIDIGEHYIYRESTQESRDQEQHQEQQIQTKTKTSIQQVLESYKVKKPDVTITAKTSSSEEITYMKALDDERQAYTQFIKHLRPEPSDDPAKFEKFEVKLDAGKEFLTATEPLKVSELPSNACGEFYIETRPVYQKQLIYDYLFEEASKIRYYTKNVLAVEKREHIEYDDKYKYTTILIKYELNKNLLQIYVKGRTCDLIDYGLLRKFVRHFCLDSSSDINDLNKIKDEIRSDAPVEIKIDNARRSSVIYVDIERITYVTNSKIDDLDKLRKIKTWKELLEYIFSRLNKSEKNAS